MRKGCPSRENNQDMGTEAAPEPGIPVLRESRMPGRGVKRQEMRPGKC